MATHSSILAGKSQGQRRLEGYSPWGWEESDSIHTAAILDGSESDPQSKPVNIGVIHLFYR